MQQIQKPGEREIKKRNQRSIMHALIVAVIVLICFLSLPHSALACGFCSGWDAGIHVDADIMVREERIVGFRVSWTFSEYMTGGMFGIFGLKARSKIPAADKEAVKKKIESDAIKNRYYFSVMVDDQPAEPRGFDNIVLHFNEEWRAVYSFDIIVDIPPSDTANLRIWFLDPENYYNFFFSGKKTATWESGGWEFAGKLSAGQIMTIAARRLPQTPSGTEFPVLARPRPAQDAGGKSEVQPRDSDRQPGKSREIISRQPWWRSHVTLIRSGLAGLQRRLNTSFQQVKAGAGAGPYLFILLISYLYGLLHAAAPGHGKTLMASYIAAHPERLRTVLFMALGIGLVHVLTGVSVAVALNFFLNVVLAKAVADLSMYTTKISGAMIVLVALYMFYMKIRHGSFHAHDHDHSSHGFRTHAARQSNKLVVIAAGLVPCPGLVLVFLFCMALEIYLVGFISAVAIGSGIATVQLIAGSVMLAARKTLVTRLENAVAVLEYGAVIFIFTLGMILFFFNPAFISPLPGTSS